MWQKLLVWTALALNALAVAFDAVWLTSGAGRHQAAGLAPPELLGLGLMSLTLLTGPAAAFAVLSRHASLPRR